MTNQTNTPTTMMLTKNTDKLRREVAAHVAADSVAQGSYDTCFIGCLSGGGDRPDVIEREYGLPVMVQRIAESIFDALPADEAVKFFAAVPDAVDQDNKDLSRVGWQFLAAELLSVPAQPAEIQAFIDPVIAGMDLMAAGKKWSDAALDAAAAVRAVDWAAEAAARRRQRDLLLHLIQNAPVIEVSSND